jgi:hypothetical protein
MSAATPAGVRGGREVLALERLVWWMKSDNPKASPFAAKELLNRGWGQAPQYQEHSGELRNHIISDSPKLLGRRRQSGQSLLLRSFALASLYAPTLFRLPNSIYA